MRKNLSVDELGDLLERPFNAVLATYRQDGSVLLSPVWHEWRDGGFNVVTGASDVKIRHIQRDRRAAIVVAENEAPFRGIEVSGAPTIDPNVLVAQATMERIAARYLGSQRGSEFTSSLGDDVALIRLAPGQLRTWDFADDQTLA